MTSFADHPERLVPHLATRLTGDEPIADGRAVIADFWRWAFSDLRDNVNRGVLAEWIVGLALGCVDGVRSAWDEWDLVCGDVRIEVKSAAYLQAWESERHSRIEFSRLAGAARDGETGRLIYRADVFVFALQTARDHARFDPLDVAQWSFWVASRTAIEGCGYRSLGLTRVQEIAEGPLHVEGLAAAVRRASS